MNDLREQIGVATVEVNHPSEEKNLCDSLPLIYIIKSFDAYVKPSERRQKCNLNYNILRIKEDDFPEFWYIDHFENHLRQEMPEEADSEGEGELI